MQKRSLYEATDRIFAGRKKPGLDKFLVRLGGQYQTIADLFYRLYGERDDVESQLTGLLVCLADMFADRSAKLRALDAKREADPHWYMSPEWVGTMFYVDRYSNDLPGLEQRLDYLQELGVNYLHLMPLLKMPAGENDGGYAVSDYREVEARFGTMNDLEHLGSLLNDKNMLLELDLVLNHTADNHPWAEAAKAGDSAAEAMYYTFADRTLPDQYEQTMLEIFPETAPGNFTWDEALQKWVLTTFNTYQWDLNYTNPRVFIEMVQVLLYLANKGVDILRLDAVAFMWKQVGTQCQNLDQAHWILKLFKACAKIVAPGVLFKAEAIVQPREIIKYLGDGGVDECEIAYNASLMVYLWDAMATGNTMVLKQGLRNAPRLPAGTTWINYIRCHDDIGLGYADEDISSVGFTPWDHRQFIISYYVGEFFGSKARGERFMYNPKTGDARISGATASLLGLQSALEEGDQAGIDLAIKKILLMHSVIMSFGGIPLVYYGDELATCNDYSFLENPALAADNRWLNRPVMDWQRAEQRRDGNSIEGRVFAGLQRQISVRKALPELHNANDYTLIESHHAKVLAYVREHEGSRVLVLANFADGEVFLPASVIEQAGLSDDVYDVISGKQGLLQDGVLRLHGFQYLWLKQR